MSRSVFARELVNIRLDRRKAARSTRCSMLYSRSGPRACYRRGRSSLSRRRHRLLVAVRRSGRGLAWFVDSEKACPAHRSVSISARRRGIRARSRPPPEYDNLPPFSHRVRESGLESPCRYNYPHDLLDFELARSPPEDTLRANACVLNLGLDRFRLVSSSNPEAPSFAFSRLERRRERRTRQDLARVPLQACKQTRTSLSPPRRFVVFRLVIFRLSLELVRGCCSHRDETSETVGNETRSIGSIGSCIRGQSQRRDAR